MALHNGTAFTLSREIIDRKLAGQERVARRELGDGAVALVIRQYRSELAEVDSGGGLDVKRLGGFSLSTATSTRRREGWRD
jgi:hypothetical protein